MEGKEVTEERFIECLAIDFPNFKITKSNLTHPTSQFVMSFYSLILRHTIDLDDPEECWNLTENQQSYINSYHPEAATFSQHVWANNLHAAVKYVFSQLSQSGSEFVYSDILFPENTPRRSFVFMALMLNFYWYSSDFATDLNSDMTACLEEVRLIHSLKSDKEKLINQIKEFESQNSQYAESYKDIKKYINKCMDSNEEQENVIKELLTKKELVLKDLEKVEREEQQLQETLTKLKNEEKYLESLVVSNQKQVIDIHKKRIRKKDECVKKIKTLEEQAKVASSKLQQSNKVLELQQKLNHFLKDEKFLPESRGKHRGFQDLFENINMLSEKKKKLSEEESTLAAKSLEAEETILKLKNEYKQHEARQEEILSKSKEKIGILSNLIDAQKKNHSQLFIKMRKDAEEMEEFDSVSAEMSAKCDEIEDKLKHYDSENETRFATYVREMTSALNSIQAIFEEDKKFF